MFVALFHRMELDQSCCNAVLYVLCSVFHIVTLCSLAKVLYCGTVCCCRCVIILNCGTVFCGIVVLSIVALCSVVALCFIVVL